MNGTKNTHSEGKNPEGETPTNPEGMTYSRANIEIKCETSGKMEVEENEMETHKTTDCATWKRLLYTDKEDKEDETGSKIVPVHQENLKEDTEARYEKASYKNEQNKIIRVKVNGKWRAQEKTNNKQNSVYQEKGAYNDITYKYLQKIDEHIK